MAVVAKLSYKRLTNEDEFEEEAAGEKRASGGIRRWFRFRKLTGGKNRPKIQIPGLRRFLRRRSRLITTVRVSWRKTLKRLKEGQALAINDLFSGNFMFMQVISPAPFKSVKKSVVPRDLHGLSSKHSLGRIA